MIESCSVHENLVNKLARVEKAFAEYEREAINHRAMVGEILGRTEDEDIADTARKVMAENARLREALEESKRWVYTNGGWVRKAETGESK